MNDDGACIYVGYEINTRMVIHYYSKIVISFQRVASGDIKVFSLAKIILTVLHCYSRHLNIVT